MQLSAISLAITRLWSGSSAWTPTTLFAAGEQGGVWDFTNLSNLYQDSAGTTPCTAVGDPIGLVLDTKNGTPVLGPELVTNGDFSNGTTGWSALGSTLSVVSGALRVTNVNEAFGASQQIVTTVIGKNYKLTFTVGSQTNTSSAWIGSSSSGTQYHDFDSILSGTYSLIFTATSTTLSLRFLNRQNVNGNYSDFDNISVKELPGNHLTQSTSTKRPTLGRMPATGVRNLLTYTEDFSNAVWWKDGITAAAQRVTEDSTTGVHLLLYSSGALNCSTATIRASQGTRRYLSIWSGAHVEGYITFDLQTGSISEQGTYITTSSIVSSELGGYVCSVQFNSASAIRVAMANGPTFGWNSSYTGDGSKYLDIYSSQFENGAATAYQKVVQPYDITESGVASVYTAYFDGLDDCLVSPSIDFTATDKMSVFAGVRKVTDEAIQILCESSAAADLNNGAFNLVASNLADGGKKFQFVSKGSTSFVTAYTTSTSFNAPKTLIATGTSDISGDRATLRLNGIQEDQSTADQGSGNFGNYVMYVGQRNASNFSYKGFLSALAVRGAATDAAIVTSMEKWLASKTPGVLL